MDTSNIEVNGDWPDIENKVLDELICIEMLYEGKVIERANVNYLKLDEQWYRLYFDCGIIFWRKDDDGPVGFDAPELACSFRAVPVGVQLELNGQKVQSVSAQSFDSGSEVNFVFGNNQQVIFYDYNDVSDYRT